MTRESRGERKLRKKMSREEKSTPRVTLFPDEMVVMTAHPARISTLPKFIGTLGMYEFWRKRDTAVITDRRILFGQGIFRRTEQSIPLKNVTDVVFVRRGANCYAEVAISDRGRGSIKLIGPMSGSTARHLVSEILRRL